MGTEQCKDEIPALARHASAFDVRKEKRLTVTNPESIFYSMCIMICAFTSTILAKVCLY